MVLLDSVCISVHPFLFPCGDTEVSVSGNRLLCICNYTRWFAQENYMYANLHLEYSSLKLFPSGWVIPVVSIKSAPTWTNSSVSLTYIYIYIYNRQFSLVYITPFSYVLVIAYPVRALAKIPFTSYRLEVRPECMI